VGASGEVVYIDDCQRHGGCSQDSGSLLCWPLLNPNVESVGERAGAELTVAGTWVSEDCRKLAYALVAGGEAGTSLVVRIRDVESRKDSIGDELVFEVRRALLAPTPPKKYPASFCVSSVVPSCRVGAPRGAGAGGDGGLSGR
jgi:hypothetical protein